MNRMLCMILSAILAIVAGCDGNEPNATTGGEGGTTIASGGGGMGGTTHVGGTECPDALCPEGGSGGTGGAGGSVVCEAEAPLGCTLPDPELSFDPYVPPQGFFSPILPWRAEGASAGCMGPFEPGQPKQYAVIAMGSKDVPTEMPIDIWATDTPDPTNHVLDYKVLPFAATEPTVGGAVLARYKLPEPIEGAPYLCIATSLADYYPLAVGIGSCEVPTFAWWRGLPWNEQNGDGEPQADELTWAPLACPIDTTTDDGTPAVNAYHVHLGYGVRP